MRIAIMLRTLDEKGGIAVYTENLVRSLVALQTQHEFVLLYRSAAHVGRFGQQPNVKERVVLARTKPVWDQVAVPWACRRDAIDVLLHPKFTVPLLARTPSVMVLHGADWFLPEAARFYTWLDRTYIRAFMPLYLRKSAAVLSVSQLTTDHFERIFSLPPGKVHTVYFAAAPHFQRVTDADRLDNIRRRYNLPDRFVLTLSKQTGGERKNVRGILQAFEVLHRSVPHALVVGGLGCDRFRHEHQIPSDGWGKRVHFPGWIDQQDLPGVYTMADLFLYPSNQEAFPIPVTEAMACGTPILTSNANGLAEIAGDAAVLVDADDPAAIAASAQRILMDDELQRRLVAAGRNRAAMFSWTACARRTLAIVEEAGMEGRRHPRAPLRNGDANIRDGLTSQKAESE